jgi:hypothetical protein
MCLSAGAISSRPSALNERLSLVAPPIYQPFEPRARFCSYYLNSLCSPGSLAGISKNRIVSLNYSRGTGRVRNGEKFHWSRPNGRYLALSGPVCTVEPPHTRGISSISLEILRNRGRGGGAGRIRTLGVACLTRNRPIFSIFLSSGGPIEVSVGKGNRTIAA